MWVKEVLREEENNEKRKEGLLSIISTDGELQKQIDIIRKYRHDIPKHIHMMEEAIDRDIMEKRFCDNELLNAVAKIKEAECQQTVSYTHLDVYKRQDYIQSPEKNIIATYKKEQKDTKECIQSLEQNMVTTYEKKRVPSYSGIWSGKITLKMCIRDSIQAGQIIPLHSPSFSSKQNTSASVPKSLPPV